MNRLPVGMIVGGIVLTVVGAVMLAEGIENDATLGIFGLLIAGFGLAGALAGVTVVALRRQA